MVFLARHGAHHKFRRPPQESAAHQSLLACHELWCAAEYSCGLFRWRGGLVSFVNFIIFLPFKQSRDRREWCAQFWKKNSYTRKKFVSVCAHLVLAQRLKLLGVHCIPSPPLELGVLLLSPALLIVAIIFCSIIAVWVRHFILSPACPPARLLCSRPGAGCEGRPCLSLGCTAAAAISIDPAPLPGAPNVPDSDPGLGDASCVGSYAVAADCNTSGSVITVPDYHDTVQ